MPDLGRITQSFVLDFKKPVVNRLKVVNGDTANTFIITLANGGAAVQLNADLHKVVAVFKRADGQVYTQDAETGCTFTTAGVVTIDVRAASFRSGTNTVELQVYKRESASATEYPLLATTYPQAFTARNETLTGAGENAPDQYPMLERYVLAAKSYAHGGTGTREGEDTDNAMYYCQLAETYARKEYVTPEMYGAYGDGSHDDTDAVQRAVNSGKICIGFGKTYKVANVKIQHSCDVRDCDFFVESKASTGAIAGYAFLVDADDLSVSFSRCTFRSTNDRNTSTDYVAGNTSNICLVGGVHTVSGATFDRCSFTNAYYAIYLKRDPLSKFRCANCEFVGHVMGVDIAYCEDAIIDGCTFRQNTASTSKAHDVYVAEGTGNKVLIRNCEFESVSPTIHCNHGTGYDITVESCSINTTAQKPFIATQPDSGTIVQNKMSVKHSTIVCSSIVSALEYNTAYLFDNCDITCTGAGASLITRTNSADTQNGSATFSHCRIKSKRLTYVFGATFNECTITLNSGSSRIVENAGTSLYCCKCVYTCTNDQPIKANGNCKIMNNYMENTESTDKCIYITNTGNVIKGNTFVGIPNASVGSADLTDNIFVA